MSRLTLAAASLAIAVAAPALAHHSRANFDLDSVVEVDGVVTEFSWRNPHAFVVVDGTQKNGSKALYTFELNSTPVLTRFGWKSDTLKQGDHVVARGNPDRNAERHFIYANLFVKDGKDIWAWGGPQLTQRQPPSAEAAAAKSIDYSGVWRIQFQGDVLGRNRPDSVLVNTLPVTAKGQAQIDAFDPDKNPEWDCAPQSMPTILGYPYPFELTRPDDKTIVLRYEVNEVERVIHLDRQTHPNVAPSPLGHSIGWFEDGELIIETAKFSRVRWGSGPGVDSGEQKTTVERYRLSEDGKSLLLLFVMTDPEYLTRPVMVENKYNLNAGYKLQEYLCDPATSRRHLHAGE